MTSNKRHIMDKTLLEIRRISDTESSTAVNISNKDEFNAVAVGIISALRNNKRLELAVTCGLLEAHAHPEMLNTTIVKGETPGDNK